MVKDNAGNFTRRGYSLALWESLSLHPLVTTPELMWGDGSKHRLVSLERQQVLIEDGKPKALFCAAADRADRIGSFNIQIPLKTRGE